MGRVSLSPHFRQRAFGTQLKAKSESILDTPSLFLTGSKDLDINPYLERDPNQNGGITQNNGVIDPFKGHGHWYVFLLQRIVFKPLPLGTLSTPSLPWRSAGCGTECWIPGKVGHRTKRTGP